MNLKTGLPSASGKNSVELNSTTTYFGSPYDPGLAPNEGRKLSEFWHSAKR